MCVCVCIPEGLVPDDNKLAILAALGDEDPDDESFEQMFARLQVMKGQFSCTVQ